MTFNYQELENWFIERPKWLQDAARRLIQAGHLTDDDFVELEAIWMAEATEQPVTITGLPTGVLRVQEATTPLRLDSLVDVKGVNALRPSKPLIFGTEQLCIVYGRNGAGKSGYVRLLKHACGSRNAGELLPNIFEATAQQQSATININENGQTKSLLWSGGSVPSLHEVDIYDTACGLIYVNDENEVAFEPYLLRFFSQLTAVCDTAKQRIQAKIASLASRKPTLPLELIGTPSGLWYSNLSYQTSKDEVVERSIWTPEDELALQRLISRLAEANPASRAQAYRRQCATLQQLVLEIQLTHEAYSDDRCRSYVESKTDANLKHKAAHEDAKKVFDGAPLAGVGSETWLLLWEAARKYSEQHAYVKTPFPNVGNGARCVLCQTELDQQTRFRLESFETYVTSELQTKAKTATRRVAELESAFPEVLSGDPLTTRIDSVEGIDDSLRNRIIVYQTALLARRTSCLSAAAFKDLDPLPPDDISADFEHLSSDLEKNALASDEDAKGQNRPKLENDRLELTTRKWLNQQRPAIDNEISRLVEVHDLHLAEDLTNTSALSRRKSAIAEELITNAYVQRFNDELKALDAGGLQVEIRKTKTQVGKVYHRIVLRNTNRQVKNSDILSEGEFRIVSLAVFLADTEGRGARTTFVFDDPISSLDHVFEDATARRLVALSRVRQVIVFTHRLSLVGLLEKYTDKESVSSKVVSLSNIKTGEISDLALNMKPKHKANKLLNDGVKLARQAYETGDAQYESVAKNLCRDIRILLEEVVEIELLRGIVRRFSQEVQTKNKIEHLAKITDADCKFIDDLMTKYSRFEHSQSDETQLQFPSPDEFAGDLGNLVALIDSLKKR